MQELQSYVGFHQTLRENLGGQAMPMRELGSLWEIFDKALKLQAQWRPQEVRDSGRVERLLRKAIFFFGSS